MSYRAASKARPSLTVQSSLIIRAVSSDVSLLAAVETVSQCILSLIALGVHMVL